MMIDHRTVLRDLGDLEDAIVVELRTRGSTYEIHMVVDVTWSLRNAGVEVEIGTRRLVRFVGVEQVHLRNDFPEPIHADPAEIGWSHSELVGCDLDRQDLGEPLPGRTWITLLFHRDQRLDIMFKDLIVEEAETRPISGLKIEG